MRICQDIENYYIKYICCYLQPNESEKRGSHSKNTADSEFGTDTGQLQTHMPRLKRHVHWPDNQDKEVFTSLKVTRQHKEVSSKSHSNTN